MDTDYINGTYNDNGELVIRPLNNKETAWLDQFYKETLGSSFNERDSFYSVDGIETLTKNDIKTIRGYFFNKDKTLDKELLNNTQFIKTIAEDYDIIPETVVNLIQRKLIYDSNNSLNSDIFSNRLPTPFMKYQIDVDGDGKIIEILEDCLDEDDNIKIDELKNVLAFYDNNFENAMIDYLDYLSLKKSK